MLIPFLHFLAISEIANQYSSQARIVRNKAGRDTTGLEWSWPQVKDALADPQTWLSFCNAFINNIPNGCVMTTFLFTWKVF